MRFYWSNPRVFLKKPGFLNAFVIALCLLTLDRFGMAQLPSGIAPPLHTEGSMIVDARGTAVRLISVNWFGFDEGEYVVGGLDHAPLSELVQRIKDLGFNSVRLPWANQIVEDDPVVPDYALSKNPALQGKKAMQVMDAVVNALTAQGLLVILDNHVSRSDWCCNDKDGNGLWYNREYPEAQWLEDWRAITQRYKNNPRVVGADLRNELRSGARWGGIDPTVDWHRAAEQGGNAVLAVNPNLLIIVEGPGYSVNLEDFGKLPVRLSVQGRLVYSPHNYAWSQPPPTTYQAFKNLLDRLWGYLLEGAHPVPVWVGEIGTCQLFSMCKSSELWFEYLTQYIRETKVGWGYWPLNATQSSGSGRLYGTVEGYGLLAPDYATIAAPEVLHRLETIGLDPLRSSKDR